MTRPAAMPRKIVVHIATSADGYIARPDEDMEWLTSRPAPKGFYGLPEFERSIDTKILGRKTFDWSLKLGAGFGGKTRHVVFSHRPPPASAPAGVEFVNESVASFVSRLRQQDGRNIWLMGGGGIIASFLDAGAIDEFVVSVVPVFIGEGIPLIAPRHRHVPLSLRSVTPFPDGVVQVHYDVPTTSRIT
jgi:dihydrofolate reductase